MRRANDECLQPSDAFAVSIGVEGVTVVGGIKIAYLVPSGAILELVAL